MNVRRQLIKSLCLGLFALLIGCAATSPVGNSALSQTEMEELEARIAEPLAALNAGDYQQAVRLARIGLKRIDPQENNADLLRAAHQAVLGGALLALGQHKEAEKNLRYAYATSLVRLGPTHRYTLIAATRLARSLDLLKKEAEAEDLYRMVLANATSETVAGLSVRGVALNDFALLMEKQYRLREAEALVRESISITEKLLGVDDREVAVSLLNLVRILESQGRYDVSEANIRRALAIREKQLGPDHPDTADSYGDLAKLFEDQGRNTEAEKLRRKSLAIIEQAFGPSSRQTVDAVMGLATTLHIQDRPVEVENLAMEYLQKLEANPQTKPQHLAMILGVLRGAVSQQYRSEEGLRLAERAYTLLSEELGPDHISTINSRFGLAMQYALLGEHAQDEAHTRAVLASARKIYGPGHPDLIMYLNWLPGSLLRQQRPDEALPLLQEAHDIAIRAFGPEDARSANAMKALAEALALKGENEEAEQLFRKALSINAGIYGAASPNYIKSTLGYADFLSHTGRIAEALSYYRELSQWDYQKKMASARETGYANSIYGKGLVIRHLSALTTVEPTNLDEMFWLLQLLQMGDTETQLAKMASRFKSGNNELAELAREQQDLAPQAVALNNLLVQLMSIPAQERLGEPELRAKLSNIRRRQIEIDQDLSKRYPAYKKLLAPEPLSVADTQSLLSEDEVLLSWLTSDDKTYIFLIGHQQARLIPVNLSYKSLARSVESIRWSMTPESPSAFPADIAYSLYRDLIGPTESYMKGVKHIFAVTGPILDKLPLSLLLSDPITDTIAGRTFNNDTMKNASWLIRKWPVTTLPSISSLHALRALAKGSKATRPFTGIGDPILADHPSKTGTSTRSGRTSGQIDQLFRGGGVDIQEVRSLASLPETAKELEAMAQSLGAPADAVITGTAATETKVKHLDLASSRVIAFATHGVVAGEMKGVAEPGLVLTPPDEPSQEDDGLLTASEITQLKLDADWVILSACNTAAGDGMPSASGLSGLAKAFFYAGARTLLVSHWPVDSGSTVQLTTRMMAEAAKPGVGRAEAHRRSVLHFLNDDANKKRVHPAYWAPFVVVGEGGINPVGRHTQ